MKGTARQERQLIRREGEYWTIVFDGTLCRLRHSRGLDHLAHLLRHPNEEVSALALERWDGRVEIAAGTAARARVGGHDARERARVNVTRAITGALRRIADHHPGLAGHLSATVKTGTFCRYTPDPRVAVRWTE